ncbi:hypothetical protein OE88DRAFT_1493015 [Heliocybe sulcata]|uniref:Uncharacterized protein n=1 Tax=Heliocybe sulcata TaxID=5364 RepID=A0A5C3N656_9AGAM|nr:hypothetical protein OE88DRAFT_1493015 [Heliocybe sulcata]
MSRQDSAKRSREHDGGHEEVAERGRDASQFPAKRPRQLASSTGVPAGPNAGPGDDRTCRSNLSTSEDSVVSSLRSFHYEVDRPRENSRLPAVGRTIYSHYASMVAGSGATVTNTSSSSAIGLNKRPAARATLPRPTNVDRRRLAARQPVREQNIPLPPICNRDIAERMGHLPWGPSYSTGFVQAQPERGVCEDGVQIPHSVAVEPEAPLPPIFGRGIARSPIWYFPSITEYAPTQPGNELAKDVAASATGARESSKPSRMRSKSTKSTSMLARPKNEDASNLSRIAHPPRTRQIASCKEDGTEVQDEPVPAIQGDPARDSARDSSDHASDMAPSKASTSPTPSHQMTNAQSGPVGEKREDSPDHTEAAELPDYRPELPRLPKSEHSSVSSACDRTSHHYLAENDGAPSTWPDSPEHVEAEDEWEQLYPVSFLRSQVSDGAGVGALLTDEHMRLRCAPATPNPFVQALKPVVSLDDTFEPLPAVDLEFDLSFEVQAAVQPSDPAESLKDGQNDPVPNSDEEKKEDEEEEEERKLPHFVRLQSLPPRDESDSDSDTESEWVSD